MTGEATVFRGHQQLCIPNRSLHQRVLVICVYKGLPSQADVNDNDLSQRSHMSVHFHLFSLLFPLLFLLKQMAWLLISTVWGPSMLSNAIIQALFIPIFNYI